MLETIWTLYYDWAIKSLAWSGDHYRIMALSLISCAVVAVVCLVAATVYWVPEIKRWLWLWRTSKT